MTREEILKQAKPILFNTEMVMAILDGRKTVTRRVIKPQPQGENKIIPADKGYGVRKSCGICMIEPRYHKGDFIYVRETWCKLAHVDENGITHYDLTKYFYKTDGDYQIDLYDDNGFYLDDQRIKWRPSIHMPKEAARIFLRVTDVRVEWLQDITKEQIRKEGLTVCDDCPFEYENCGSSSIKCAKQAFEKIWSSTIKSADLPLYGWNANPWVWVYEFERVKGAK